MGRSGFEVVGGLSLTDIVALVSKLRETAMFDFRSRLPCDPVRLASIVYGVFFFRIHRANGVVLGGWACHRKLYDGWQLNGFGPVGRTLLQVFGRSDLL